MHPDLSQFRSTVPGVLWPALPAGEGQQYLALLYQLEQSQWWTPKQIQIFQFRQLQILLQHAMQHVPFYREQYCSEFQAGNLKLTEELWRELPILRRSDVQENMENLLNSDLPPDHGEVLWKTSSGSTSRPIKFATTELSQKIMRAIQARDFDWQGWRVQHKIAVIFSRTEHTKSFGWGTGFDEFYETGISVSLNAGNDTATIVRWLESESPVYLVCAATHLSELARYCLKHDIHLPELRQVRAINEILRPELKDLVYKAWGVRTTQVYSCEEAGLLASDHPDSNDLYVQDENVYLELLNEQGLPCKPGEIGEVVITQLSNYAMPLIRYAIGDFAMRGEACNRGRGLSMIRQVMGRQRNYLRMADGRSLWPAVPATMFLQFPAIERFQIIQNTLSEIEISLEAKNKLTEVESERLENMLRERFMGADFEFKFSYTSHIEAGPDGKFEDVISRID